jgi:UbiD family decarboxylase
MRDYIEKQRQQNTFRVIERSVDPKFELAALTQLSQQRDDSAVYFSKVLGSKMPVVSNIYGSRQRLCDIIAADDGNFCRRWEELSRQLGNASGQAHIDTVTNDDRISGKLSDLPLITYFEKDAGPYFTSAIFLAKHPESGVANLSFHRSMFVDDDELRVRLGSTHDLFHYQKLAEELNEPLPAALLIGTSPEIFVSACASLTGEEDELQMASIIKGSPIKMSAAASIDLMFPTETEIVVEGQFLPNTLKPEGPFGEFMGYYVPVGDNHVFEVLNVSWRPDPVFHSLVCGSPEDMYPLDYATASRIYRDLNEKLPGIINVACYPYIMNTIVQIRKESEEQVHEVLMAAVNANRDYSKTCMVIDEDVNIHDLNDVWWAYLTRGRADTRAEILKDMPGFYRDDKKDHWGRLLIDATKPLDRQDEFVRKQIPGMDQINLDDYL